MSAPVSACVLVLRLRAPAAVGSPRPGGGGALAAAVRATEVLWDARQRVVLEAPDALVLLGDVPPAAALQAAQRAVQQAAARSPVVAVLHRGLVRVVADGDDGTRVAGEGLDAALALARALGQGLDGDAASAPAAGADTRGGNGADATTHLPRAGTRAGVDANTRLPRAATGEDARATQGLVVASQAFRDALAVQAPGVAAALLPVQEPSGSDTAGGAPAGVRSRGAASLTAALAQAAAATGAGVPYVFDPAAAGRQARRRTVLLSGGLLAVLAAGWGARMARQAYEAAHRPAVLLLDIRPAGEIFVDGERKGSVPPLVRLSVPPGPHTIEVRNGRFRPLRVELNLQPGEERVLKHAFVAPRRSQQPPPPAPGPFDRFKFW